MSQLNQYIDYYKLAIFQNEKYSIEKIIKFYL